MLPYKWTFKHRQSSHNILYGAIVRILYISIIVLAFYYIIFKSLSTGLDISPVYPIIFLFGIILANALHVLLDNIFSNTPLKYCIVFSNPCSRETFGSQLRIFLAFVISGLLCFGSSSGNSLKMIFELYRSTLVRNLQTQE